MGMARKTLWERCGHIIWPQETLFQESPDNGVEGREYHVDVRECQLNLDWIRMTLSWNCVRVRMSWITLHSSKPGLGQTRKSRVVQREILRDVSSIMEKPRQAMMSWTEGRLFDSKEILQSMREARKDKVGDSRAWKNPVPWCQSQDA